MSNNSRLGRGLESLIPAKKTLNISENETYKEIHVEKIKPNPYQPRLEFNEESLQVLSESIKKHGLTQPIIVRPNGSVYELIAGERRFRACVLADMATIPAIIKPFSNSDALQVALVENLDREDLNPIEIAKGYKRLVDEFDYTHEKISELFSRSRSSITNTFRLLNLPNKIQEAISKGYIKEGHARALLGIKDEETQLKLADQIIKNNLSTREVELMIKNMKKQPSTKKQKFDSPPLWNTVQERLSHKLKTKISLNQTASGGKIEINFKDSDDLERIYYCIQ